MGNTPAACRRLAATACSAHASRDKGAFPSRRRESNLYASIVVLKACWSDLTFAHGHNDTSPHSPGGRMRHLTIALVLSLAATFAGPSLAYTTGPGNASAAQTWKDPVQLLADALARVRFFAASGLWRDPIGTQAFLETEVTPYFDFEFMAAWSARPFYQQMNAAQQAQFRAAMKQRFIGLVVSGMGAYVNPLPNVRFLPARLVAPDRADVPTEIYMQPGITMR